MCRVRGSRAAFRLIVAVMASFLALGHACDVPALAEIAGHAHEVAGHPHEAAHPSSQDHHEGGGELTCDAVAGVASKAGARADLGPEPFAPGRVPVVGLVAEGSTAGPRQTARAPSGRPPLFLLHASLLI